MKKVLTISSFLLFCLAACNDDNRNPPESENDLDAVRNFIQSSLEGNYDKATTYMLPDSVNINWLKMFERTNLKPEEKQGLAAASIIIHQVDRINDSNTIVIYSNSFWNNRDTLKAVNQKGKWLVDFKYLFEHDKDTILNPPVIVNDSIR